LADKIQQYQQNCISRSIAISMAAVTYENSSHQTRPKKKKPSQKGERQIIKKPLMAPHTHTHQEAKKRKHAEHEDHSTSKKSRLTVEKSTAVPDMTAFSEVSVKLYLHLAPTWAGKTTEGINEQLNAFLMKYVIRRWRINRKFQSTYNSPKLGTYLKLMVLS
jgi:hypothetical protein